MKICTVYRGEVLIGNGECISVSPSEFLGYVEAETEEEAYLKLGLNMAIKHGIANLRFHSDIATKWRDYKDARESIVVYSYNVSKPQRLLTANDINPL